MKKLGAKILSVILAVTILMSIFVFTVPAVGAEDFLPDFTPDNFHEYKWSIEFKDTTADSKMFTVENCTIS